jgi:Uncharacterised nucleotidyltransferase
VPGSTVLDREWPVLLAACSALPLQEKTLLLDPLLKAPVRWQRLFDLADKHGVQPLLHQALTGLDHAVPADELLKLRQTFQTNLHKSLLLSRELIRIVDHLAARGLDALPYKGLALAEVLYGDIALRQSGDIDLLIRARDVPRIRDAVRELGYAPHFTLSEPQERAYLKSGYEYAFDGAAGPNLLELQWAILPRFYAVDFRMDELFQRAATLTVAGHPIRTPSREDLLLVLCAHAAKHVWGRLVWLCDIAQLMNESDLNWNWIADQARNLGIVRILRVTILAAKGLLRATISAEAEEGLPADAEASALAEEVQRYIVSDSSYNTESTAYFRLMMRLRERRADRWRFAQRLVLTPGPGEWNAVRLPRQMFPLYRFVRLSRLASRMLGK